MFSYFILFHFFTEVSDGGPAWHMNVDPSSAGRLCLADGAALPYLLEEIMNA